MNHQMRIFISPQNRRYFNSSSTTSVKYYFLPSLYMSVLHAQKIEVMKYIFFYARQYGREVFQPWPGESCVLAIKLIPIIRWSFKVFFLVHFRDSVSVLEFESLECRRWRD